MRGLEWMEWWKPRWGQGVEAEAELERAMEEGMGEGKGEREEAGEGRGSGGGGGVRWRGDGMDWREAGQRCGRCERRRTA